MIKAPWTESPEPRVLDKVHAEASILLTLGEHPRVIRYLGLLDAADPTRGLLFEEATNGDLQRYLHHHGSNISQTQRLKWCKQAAAGLAFCHSRKVLHCDLRPDNLLLDDKLDLMLRYFGGSESETCVGQGLPDFGFFDPRDDISVVTEATEVFGLGSIMYTIMAGTLPHGPSMIETNDQGMEYYEIFERLGLEGKWPDTDTILGGTIIEGCWTKKITSAQDVYDRLVELEHSHQSSFINRLQQLGRFLEDYSSDLYTTSG